MTTTKRWLEELPLESSERELLLVGKSARPADGAIDANWQALCVALGTTAIAGGVGVSSIAANSATAAKVSSSLAAGKAASAGLLVVAAKSLLIGVAVGFSVMGAGAVAEHLSHGDERPKASAQPGLAPTADRPPRAPTSEPLAPRPLAITATPASSLSSATAAFAAPREQLAPSAPPSTQSGAPSRPSPATPADKTASLSQQARELAELKRLIDSGASSEALRRLDTNFSADATSVLSEERDALYVQALDRAQRRDEARSFARRFLARYPRSPYFETMRQLLAKE